MMETRFDINPLNKIYHINNIQIISEGMESQLEKFAAANHDKTELIKEKHEQLIALKEATIFLNKVYSEMNKKEKARLTLKEETYKMRDTIDILKRNYEQLENKYNGLVEFDK